VTEKELEHLLKSNPSLRISGVGEVKAVQPIPLQPQIIKQAQKASKMTKCEIECSRMLGYEFPNCDIVPWGITLRLSNSHKYTPDFVVKDKSGIRLLVECKQRGKNGFRQHSYQRAKVMFDLAKVEYPFWMWRWTEKHCGTWNTKDYQFKGLDVDEFVL